MPALPMVYFAIFNLIIIFACQSRAMRSSASNRKVKLIGRWALQSTLPSYAKPLSSTEEEEVLRYIPELGWPGVDSTKKGCGNCAKCTRCNAENGFKPKSTHKEKRMADEDDPFVLSETGEVPIENINKNPSLQVVLNEPSNAARNILKTCLALIYFAVI